MGSGSASKGTDVKALLQELKTNRRTQGMLVAFVVILAWLLWPDAPKRRRALAASDRYCRRRAWTTGS